MKKFNKIPCSVAILTFNSAASLKKCLESVKEFSEIIVCDGGSTDETLKIAEKYGCKIIEQNSKFKYDNNKIADFSGVRNQTLDAATHDWFLYVDSDEYLGEKVVSEIRNIIMTDKSDSPKVYGMPRKFMINDVVIDCASVYPNYHTRFFNRKYIDGFRKKVHEKVIVKEGIKQSFLKNHTLVPTSVDYDKIKEKNSYYLEIEKKRHLTATKKVLLLAIKNTLRCIIARWVKVMLSFMFCRGAHMPLKKEWTATQYLLKLSVILIKLLFNKKNNS